MLDPKRKVDRPNEHKPTEDLGLLQQFGLAVSATAALLLGGCRVVPAFNPEAFHAHQKDMHARDDLQRAVEQGIAKRIPELLRVIPCAMPHLEFFDRKQIKVEFDCVHEPDTDILSSNVIACCAEGAQRIDFNRDRLALLTDALNFRGLSVEQIVEVAALVMAPIFVHEVRHAMTDDELDQAIGFHMPIGTLEDEALSRFDQAECYVAVRNYVAAVGYDSRVVENFFEHSVSNDELIWRMVRQGLPCAMDEVQSLSGEEISILKSDREQIGDLLAAKMITLKRGVAISEELVEGRKDRKLESDDDKMTQQAVEHVDSILNSARAILLEAQKVSASPEKFDALADFLRRSLESYQTRWQEQFGEMFRVKS